MAAPTPPPPHRFERRVAQPLARRCGVAAGAGLVLAVSGGADSVALLRALAAACLRLRTRGRGWELAVGHVQHHLRPDAEAEADAAFVAELAERLELPFMRADLRPPGHGNVEAWARRARYEALAEMARAYDAGFVATAHHADDQLETLLMRVLRGASVRGLGCMPWRRALTRTPTAPTVPAAVPGAPADVAPPQPAAVRLVRPMLAVDRSTVVAYLNDLGQPWRDDATNADRLLVRARLRADVLPVLRAMRPGAARRAVALADHLRDVSRLVDRQVADAAERLAAARGDAAIDRVEARLLPRVVLAALLRRLALRAGARADRLTAAALGPLVRSVRDTRGGTRRFGLAGGVSVVVERETVRVEGPGSEL